ncbi:DUF3084 domain-containing protein [Cyanobacterium stanieri LEGE 03274]|uniref:DUF3084 domain-containing protein n=1 Tax=Cyanobacterium stanieri LEGE 03274 TaxID=1828756 RepID=A0ABR9V792_9CHRO|nr:DUF3084 domain-containing protein [Cyanobacterium stanieri]MBE9223743.1 DUF3084 domain-containing protein [Cyanobacterium stanieri LEGE 03274]
MTSAYVLIFAVLILGGLIAALGDRIGTKVGKARLRLFNLRPKQTAIVVSIVTGISISASTLGILFALSASLRQGIFQLDEILNRRREVEEELAQVTEEKSRVEEDLQEAQERQQEARDVLLNTEAELSQTQELLDEIYEQTQSLTAEVEAIEQERATLLEEKNNIEQQSLTLQREIREKDQELNLRLDEINEQEQILALQSTTLQELQKQQQDLRAEIQFRDQQISNLDSAIAQRDQTLTEKEELLSRLERDRKFFEREIQVLEQYYRTYQDLRERPIALVRGQLITITLVRVEDNTNLEELIDGVLNEANRGAMRILGYGEEFANQRFVQISTAQVEQIRNQLSEKGEYLIQILAAGNYVQGEETVRIFTDVSPNQKVYEKDEIIALSAIESNDISNNNIQEKLDFLLSVTQFRARQQGVLGRIVIGDGQLISLVNFIQELEGSNQGVDEIRAVASNTTYSSGPLQVNLLVMYQGQEIMRL